MNNVLCFWSKAHIPTIWLRNCVRKLKVLYEEWQAIARNRSRKSDPGGRRAKFRSKLDKVWDIAAKDS